jgi:heme exporter protein B
MIRTAAILFRKDVLVEVRTLQSLTAMTLFSVMAFVLFHFGLQRDTVEGALAAGVLWVTLLLATVLAVTRLFVAEREQGGFETLLLAPIDRTAVFLGKGASLFVFLIAVEIVAVPAFDVLLLKGTVLDAPELIAVILLADIGLAAVGALVAALGAETDARELIVPLLLMPLLVPVVIAASKASAPLLSDPAHAEDLGRWLLMLTFYDLAFVLVSVGVFDYLLED